MKDKIELLMEETGCDRGEAESSGEATGPETDRGERGRTEELSSSHGRGICGGAGLERRCSDDARLHPLRAREAVQRGRK